MKQIKTKLLPLFIFILAFSNSQESFAQATNFSYNNYTNGQGDSLKYRLLFPDYGPPRTYPLVIFLHGSGERGNDNEAQLKWGVHNFAKDANLKSFPALVIAPQCPSGEGWANISITDTKEIRMASTPSKSMELLIALIQESIENLPVDTNRIYITGLSMGGYGTFDALQRYPDLFAAAVPVCGAGDLSKSADIAHIPMWIFTGAEDTAVDPVYSQKMMQALQDAGAKPGFTQYPEVGHFSWIAAYSDPMMMAWLFRQRKK